MTHLKLPAGAFPSLLLSQTIFMHEIIPINPRKSPIENSTTAYNGMLEKIDTWERASKYMGDIVGERDRTITISGCDTVADVSSTLLKMGSLVAFKDATNDPSNIAELRLLVMTM